MRYLGTNQPTGKNVYVYACKMLQNTLKKISSSGLSLGPSQRILVFFFSWKCVMKVHRHFLYHRKHNALFKKCFQLVDGMMTVNTNVNMIYRRWGRGSGGSTKDTVQLTFIVQTDFTKKVPYRSFFLPKHIMLRTFGLM